MKESHAAVAEWGLRVAAGVGLGISGLLLHEYLGPDPTLCGDGGGCDAVRESSWAWPLGIPMPIFGVLFFAGALVTSALRGPARRLFVAWALAGGLAAGGFIALQASVIHAWCKYCLVADGAAIAIALLAIPASSRPGGWPMWRGRFAIAAIAAAAALVPFALTPKAAAPAEPVVQVELPPPVAAAQQPGVVTIVEYLDFECPVCRRLHRLLSNLLRDYPAVRVVRKMAPLNIHRFAEPAARTWCCAEDAGKGDEMADALMDARSLDPSACEELAVELGIEVGQFRSCFAAAETAERVRADKAEARTLGIRGLPTFWIGSEKFTGLPSEKIVRASLDRALAALDG